MIHPPIQRHPSLRPLSRDHHVGLVQARRLLNAAAGDTATWRAALAEFLRAWSEEIAPHFDDEERLLVPLIREPGDVRRLHDEHARVRSMANAAQRQYSHTLEPAWIRRLSRMLEDHIRWEERVLFPAIEEAAGGEPLVALGAVTAQIEARRRRPWTRGTADTAATRDANATAARADAGTDADSSM
jgi:iron-sulfur cluster repair protein YtfE (RIC family)